MLLRELGEPELHVLDASGRPKRGRRSARGPAPRAAACAPRTVNLAPRRAMVTSSADSICRRFSSSAPHRRARRWLSTGSSLTSTGLARFRRARLAASGTRAAVMRTSTNAGLSAACAGSRESSLRDCCRCGRQSSAGLFFDRPSTRTRWVVPTIASLIARAWDSSWALQALQALELFFPAASHRRARPRAFPGRGL